MGEAIANGCKHVTCLAEDGKRDTKKYGTKTLRNKNIALNRYKKLVPASALSRLVYTCLPFTRGIILLS